MLVAYGEQYAAAQMLRHNCHLLLERADVTDYSGRTFKNITAYEYAYWAKDTHMCRMLEAHMDQPTKANMLERIDAMERDGLTYEQHGVVVEHSKHFDFKPLITALTRFIEDFDNALDPWKMGLAWMNVGLAQRDIPVHVMNEYLHPHRSFDPIPSFNEETLPRNLTFYNWDICDDSLLFPLVVSNTTGLGVDFALSRGSDSFGNGGWCGEGTGIGSLFARLDLAALNHLDEVRTEDLTQSRKNLQTRGLEATPS